INYFKTQNSELSEELQKVSEENEVSENLTSFDLTPGNDGPTVANYKVDKTSDVDIENSFEVKIANDEEIVQSSHVDDDDDLKIEVKKLEKEKEVDDNLSDKLVKEFGEFDPKLELSNYKFPSLELLSDHGSGGSITINQEELEENKNKIVETLKNYKIGIAQIKATIGPTVTLYEIVPEAGIR